MISNPKNWAECANIAGYHFAMAGESCLFFIHNDKSKFVHRETPFWQINRGNKPSIYRNKDHTNFDKYHGPKEATREEFLDYLLTNFPDQFQWFLFHPEWLQND